ncbi:MAG TPA: hypothetical protein VD838_07855, partial [Anaeromyxobacteraceae bacterium]|nr:hypothetical protein [Anaeromyxobacteraceae bacterium]
MSGRTPVGARGIVRRTLERCGLRALADALLHPEPLALAADDPLLADAARQARRTIGELRRLRVGRAGPAAVRFALETDGGETEHVWGEV